MRIEVNSLDFDTMTVVDQNGQTINVSLQSELKIDEYNMTKEFMQQGSKYAWWANLLEIVRYHAEAENIKLETISSQLNITIRQQLEATGKKPTKDTIESLIYIDEKYQEQLSVVNEWNYKAGQLNRIIKAFEQRKDMLQMIGAEQRQTNKHGGITSPLTY